MASSRAPDSPSREGRVREGVGAGREETQTRLERVRVLVRQLDQHELANTLNMIAVEIRRRAYDR